MVDFGAPYAMDGTVIPGAGLRRQQQRDSGEGSGVARPGDLKISQLDVPAAGIKIALGDDIIQCRAPGRDRESYSVPLFTEQNYFGDDGLGIPGTGSQVPPDGFRRDMIFHEMLDPSFPKHFTPVERWPEGQSSKLSIIQNVDPTARTIEDIPELEGVTGYALAAVKYPPNTATIQDAMIEDLRTVHSPKMRPLTINYSLAGATTDSITATTPYPNGGQTWPIQAENAGELGVDVPPWATHLEIEATFYGVLYPAGNAWGSVWIQLGPTVNPDNVKSQDTRWDSDNSTIPFRTTFGLADTIAIPPALRGKRLKIYPRATRVGGTNANTARMDRVSSLAIKGWFLQKAV